MVWALTSGYWSQAEGDLNFELKETIYQRTPSRSLTQQDIQIISNMRCSAANSAYFFPLEFNHNPHSGEKLDTIENPSVYSWATPAINQAYIKSAASNQNTPYCLGLRNTDYHLELKNKQITSFDPEATLPLPPRGEYEFLTLNAGTVQPILAAINMNNDDFYLYAPYQKKWLLFNPFNNNKPITVAEINTNFYWRFEIITDTHVSQNTQYQSRIFLPSADGLTCLIPDALSLTYETKSIGKSPALASPIRFKHGIYLPIAHSKGIQLVGMTLDGQPIKNEIIISTIFAEQLGTIFTPISNHRFACWACQHGQIILKTKFEDNAEKVVAEFIPWGEGITAQFEFGVAYFSRSGEFLQLCYHEKQHSYGYIPLNKANATFTPTDRPRTCSGELNFDLTNKSSAPPWENHDHNFDVNHTFPLIESKDKLAENQKQYFGILVRTTESLSELIQNTERQTTDIIFNDDRSGNIRMTSYTLKKPWDLRLFIYNNMIWTYHPDRNFIDGWSLME